MATKTAVAQAKVHETDRSRNVRHPIGILASKNIRFPRKYLVRGHDDTASVCYYNVRKRFVKEFDKLGFY